MKKLRFAIFMILASCQFNAFALSGELGRWIKSNAGPELARLIQEEPRFIGEAIDIIALRDGHPAAVDDGLTESIREALRHLLLNQSGIRMPLQTTNQCQATRTHIVLGISIDQQDAYQHRVQLALLDLDENMWINQSSQVWLGRLSRQQDRLLGTFVSPDDDVFDQDNAAAIASMIDEKVRCGMPLPQPVYIETENPHWQKAVESLLEKHLDITRDPIEAASSLVMIRQQQQLNIHVASPHNTYSLTRLALSSRHPESPLISAITLSNRKIECRGQGRRCIDIEYETYKDAFVFEFFTRSGELTALNCDTRPRVTSGQVRKGLRVPDAGHPSRPALSYYVLATRNPAIAEKLADSLHAASRRCHGEADANNRKQLALLVASKEVTWRSLHLIHRHGRVEAMRVAS